MFAIRVPLEGEVLCRSHNGRVAGLGHGERSCSSVAHAIATPPGRLASLGADIGSEIINNLADQGGAAMTLHVGMLLYPRLTQLDLTGPFEVMHRIPGAEVHLVWKDLEPVRADSGLGLLPTKRLSDCPPLDVLFVPGGVGQIELMTDDAVLAFLAQQGKAARYVTSVCTGSLLLGAAGLLEGYDATTHWAFTELLPSFGARVVRKRVVVDRNRITAGGVTAGIDFGLQIAADLAGEGVAKRIQLAIEYDPEPPFRSGHPDVADPALVAAMRRSLAGTLERRRGIIDRIRAGSVVAEKARP